jgi:hypothetical protein
VDSYVIVGLGTVGMTLGLMPWRGAPRPPLLQPFELTTMPGVKRPATERRKPLPRINFNGELSARRRTGTGQLLRRGRGTLTNAERCRTVDAPRWRSGKLMPKSYGGSSIAALGRCAAAAGLQTASLDEVLCITTV